MIGMYNLYQECFRVQQGNKSVADYFVASKRISEELNANMPITTYVKKILELRE